MSSGNRDEKRKAWSLDQLTKSAFFHQKLHQWKLLEVAEAIESVRGETLDWQLDQLHISQSAWNKIIHRGIKPIILFAHPDVLKNVPQSTGYYRMLAMVSQKSMIQIGLDTTTHEQTQKPPNDKKALALCRRLNTLISNLIETDEIVNAHEFDLWRGMAAGAQAQGSWQNIKGDRAEVVLKGLLYRQLQDANWIAETAPYDENRHSRFVLSDGREMLYADEPDIAFIRNNQTIVAVEIKGGIDKAGVLERVGAAIKSLSRTKHDNPDALTILLMQSVSVTQQAIHDLNANQGSVTHWFTIEEIIDHQESRDLFFQLLEV